MQEFYTILTNIGKSKIANATMLGKQLNLVKFSVGDGGGTTYDPTEDQLKLKHEVWKGHIHSIETDKENPNWIIITAIIPPKDGGFTIREAGILDNEDNLIAIAKYPESYKPKINSGTAKELCLKIILEVSNTSSVTLNINPSILFATYEDLKNLEHSLNDNVNKKLREFEENNKKVLHRSEEIEESITKINVDIAILKGSTINNMTNNVFFERLEDLEDINLSSGIFDNTNKRVVI